MKVVVKLLGKEFARRYLQNDGMRNLLVLIPFVPVVLFVFLILGVTLFVCLLIVGQNAGGCGTTVPVSAPAGTVRTAGQTVRYFESQGIASNAAAGIVGNLQQENGFSPATNGGGVGIAQWDATRGAAMQVWDQQNGLDASTVGGQLAYLVHDLRTHYATLLAAMNSAPDPGAATVLFQNAYEQCGNCVQANRVQYAVGALQAAGGASTAVPASFVTGGTCVAVGGGGGDPIPGFTPGRDDMGVDACAKPGMPIYAPSASVLVRIIPSWYKGQMLEAFQFSPPLAGTYQNDQIWFVAEQIVPASTTVGAQFPTGAPVATFAPSGTCIEIGWGSMTTNSGTLVPSDANPARGALTPEAEAFKTYFHVPWVGQSP